MHCVKSSEPYYLCWVTVDSHLYSVACTHHFIVYTLLLKNHLPATHDDGPHFPFPAHFLCHHSHSSLRCSPLLMSAYLHKILFENNFSEAFAARPAWICFGKVFQESRAVRPVNRVSCEQGITDQHVKRTFCQAENWQLTDAHKKIHKDIRTLTQHPHELLIDMKWAKEWTPLVHKYCLVSSCAIFALRMRCYYRCYNMLH